MPKTHLVIHHSLTADSGTVSWAAIRRYHTEVNGWRDIGYHFGVEEVGGRYEMLVGRPMLSQAAAAYQEGMNRLGVHVCFVGNYDDMPPPEGMLLYAAPHLRDICRALGIGKEGIIGHRDIKGVTKSCPGRMFSLDRLVGKMGNW